MWQDHRLAGNSYTTASTEPGPSQNSSPHPLQVVNHKDYIPNQGPAGKAYFSHSSLIPGLEQSKRKEPAGYNSIALSSINQLAVNHIQLQQAAPISPNQSISSSISASSCITSLSDQTGSFNTTCQNIIHSSSDKNIEIMKHSATSGDINHHGEFGQDINNNVILNNNKLLEIKANMPATKDSDPSEPGHMNQLNQADIAGSGGMISMSLNWPWTSMLLNGSSPGSTAAGRDQHGLQLNNIGGSRGMISDDDLHNLQDNFNWASSATRNVQVDNSSTKVMDSESVNSSLNAGLVGAAGQPGGLWGQPVFSSPSSEVVQDLHDNLSCSTEDHGQLQDVLYPAPAACTPTDHSLAGINRHPQLLRSSSFSLNSPCDDQYNPNNSMLMSIRPGNSTDNTTNNSTLTGQQWPISASTLLTPSHAGVQGQNINQLGHMINPVVKQEYQGQNINQLSHMINPVVKQEYQDMQVPLNWPPVLDQHQSKMHNSLNPLMNINAASDHRLACQNQINSNQNSMQAATNSLSANYLHQGALPAASIAGQHIQNPNIMSNPASLSYHHQHQHQHQHNNMRSAGAGLAAATLRQLQHPVDHINAINSNVLSSNLKQAQIIRQHQIAQLMQSGGHKQRSCTPLDHRALTAGSMHHLDSQKAVASDLQDHHKASSNAHIAAAAAMANFDESTTHHHHVAELQGSTAVYTQQLKRPRTASTAGDHQQHQAPAAGSAPNSGPFKQTVRKEKLGDRITTLQQLVSPFGKTDTASVLLEAIRYIEFLQDQVQVLSSPYMKNATTATAAASSDPKEGGSDQQPRHDLRSKGLCLVPLSCTLHVASDNINGADIWSAAYSGNLRS